MTDSAETVTLIAVADVAPGSGPRVMSADEQFDPTRTILTGGDITFGQLEEPLSVAGTRQLFSGIAGRERDPGESADALVRAGFDVMSFAGNHTLDRSELSMFETIDAVTKRGIKLCGAGATIEEARAPSILERSGTKVGFLAYCSVIPRGYEARENKSGLAPMRARTFYEQTDWQPGTPPKIYSYAYAEDLQAMVADIKKLRSEVDVVVVSFHWGIHFIPAILAMYQFEAAHAAVDAGADLILGHHAHIMKGVEVYKGKAIFYSMNNFILFARDEHDKILDENSPPTDSQKTMIVKVTIANREIDRVAFIPTWLDWKVQPVPLPASDPRSDEVLEYMKWVCEHENLDTKFVRSGDEIVVLTS